MNQYLIPANSKKGQLLFNVFKPIDLGIVLVGAAITLLLMFAISGDSILVLFIKLLPISICLLLVLPVANYHNVRVLLTEMLIYYSNRRWYRWKGWCASYGNDEPKK